MKSPFRSMLFIAVTVLLCASTWAQGNFVYTNDDQYPNTVSAFSVSSDGTLIEVPGSPFLTGGKGAWGGFYASNRIGVAIVNNFLFASNAGSDDISVFAIDPRTGVLTAVKGSPFPTATRSGLNWAGISVAATPDGKFLFAASSFDMTITVFAIGSDGFLTVVPGSPFSALGSPDGIKVSPDGKFLAVALSYMGSGRFQGVETFTIASTGAVTSLGAFAGGTPTGIDIDCSSSFLYAGEAIGRGTIVDAYSINSNGKLTPLPGSPFTTPTGNNSNVVLLNPDDTILFVSNQYTNTITAFTVAADGTLALMTGSPFPMNGPAETPAALATNQDGTLLYVAGFSASTVSVFRIGKGGALTEVDQSPFMMKGGGMMSLTAFPPKACVLKVGIAIKALGPPPVPINPRSKGKIPVAIMSEKNFNAVTDLDTKSLTFGHTGNEPSLAFCNPAGEDMNNDGMADLVCHFNTQLTGFLPGDTIAILKGKTITGRSMQGSVPMRTVPQ